MINQFIQPIFIASLCSTCLAGLFILLRKPLLEYIGARWNYYLWFSIFIPWFSVWLPLKFLPDADVKFNSYSLTSNLMTPLQHSPIQLDSPLSNIMFSLWVIGAILCASYCIFKHCHYIFLLKKSAKSLTAEQQKLVKRALVNADVIPLSRVNIANLVLSPMICHLIKPAIYLPADFFTDYTANEQKYILQHECVHYQRCDLLANTAMLILICLNWFNPIIFLSYRYFRCAQELSCDAILSQQFSSAEKKSYGYALLKSVYYQSSHVTAMNCWWNSGKQLKERCSMLKLHHSKPIKNFLGMISFVTATSIAIAAPNLGKDDAKTSLKISNSTKSYITFSIDGMCSNEIGVTDPRSVKTVTSKSLNKACKNNTAKCETQLYPTSNCMGIPIALVTFDLSFGVQQIAVHSQDYKVSGSGFDLFLDGPWGN